MEDSDEEEQEWQDEGEEEGEQEFQERQLRYAAERQLRDAAEDGQLARVRELLDLGVHVDAKEPRSGWTALMRASSRGHTEVVKLLLGRHAEINAESGFKYTAVQVAAEEGHLQVVELLYAEGADIHHIDIEGNNALIGAAHGDHLPVCLFLLSKGVDLMVANKRSQTALSHYGQYGLDDEDEDVLLSPETLAERRTALEEAWRAGPHPSQVQRRRDEAWDRRKSLMQASAENGYRPLAHRIAAMPPVDPAAAIPAIPLDNAEQLHAHLLGQVLANEGIHRNIVSML